MGSLPDRRDGELSFPDLNPPPALPFHSTYTSKEEHGLERICPHGASVLVCGDRSLKALPFFYPHVNLTPGFTPGMGRSEVLCSSESRDLPFLLKYLPLNGISSWRQWLNVKDKQVGMGKGSVLGAGHSRTPPAVVAVLRPCMQKAGWAQGSSKMPPCARSERAARVS